jgi:two-component system cell cycle response regulator
VNVPVLVLSGLTDSQDKVAAFDLGAIDYITKPFDFVELRIRIRAALRLNELITMLARRAQIDGMSGLWNRVYFDNRLQEAVDGVARHGHALTVALVDLDHFKSINDTYGHPAGDTVIQGLASIVTEQCRSTDVCCRYGGEEFAIIMPDTTPEAAQAVCERIRLQLKDTVWSRHPERTVTGSFGVVGVARTRPSARRSASGSRPPTRTSTRPSRAGGTRSSRRTCRRPRSVSPRRADRPPSALTTAASHRRRP